MLLEGRNAIVYGGGGAIGGAVARDVTLNVITHGDVQGTPLVDMTAADVEQPVVNGLRTNFLTAQAAARHMIPQGSGVILAFGGYGDPMPRLQPRRTPGRVPGHRRALTPVRRRARAARHPGGDAADRRRARVDPDEYAEVRHTITEDTVRRTLLRRAATLADVGNAAVFAASDWARTMTATSLNITCGTEIS
jgi:NAD(P)-dependent dehydrogenase (short-subunit alcohol dehydrogenase family)